MANINLGKIRSLGYQRGFAESELSRQRAEAKMAEEDRAYQRLLKRDEENRAFQSGEAEKTRESSTEQARLTREAARIRHDEATRQADRLFKLKKKQLNFQQKNVERTQAQNRLSIILTTAEKNNTLVDPSKVLGNGSFAMVPNAMLMIESTNAAIGTTTEKEAKELSQKWEIAFSKGVINPESAKLVYSRLDAGGSKILIDSDTGEKISLLKFRTILKKHQDRKRAGKINTTEIPINVGGVSFNVRNAKQNREILASTIGAGQKIEGIFKNVKMDDKNVLIALENQNLSAFNDEEKVAWKDFYVDRLRIFADGLKGKDSGSSVKMARAFMMSLGRLPGLDKLEKAGILTKEDVFSEAGILQSDKNLLSRPSTPYIAGVSDERLNKEDNPEVLDMLRVTVGTDVEGDANSMLRRDLFQRWRKQEFKLSAMYNGELLKKALLDTFRDSTGKIDIQGYNKIIRAIDIAVPTNVNERSKGKSHIWSRKNPERVLSDTGRTEFEKNKSKHQNTLNNSSEVIILAEDLKKLVQAVEAGAGVSGEVVRGFDSAIEVIRTFGELGADGFKEALNSLKFAVSGKDASVNEVSLSGLKSKSEYIVARGGMTEEALKERKRMIFNMETKAKKDLNRIQKSSLSKEAKEVRQLIVFKQIALTYRMSGLLQGDSSGRSISNQDFDFALKAIWGETFAVIPKMDAVINFFEHKRRVSKTYLDYGGSGIGDVAMDLVNSQNEEVARQHIEDTLKDLKVTVDFKGLGDATAVKAIADEPDKLKTTPRALNLFTQRLKMDEDLVRKIKGMPEGSKLSAVYNLFRGNELLEKEMFEVAASQVWSAYTPNAQGERSVTKSVIDQLIVDLVREYQVELFKGFRTGSEAANPLNQASPQAPIAANQ